MGHLEHVPGSPVRAQDLDEVVVLVLFEVAREQDALAPDGHSQDDRRVVDDTPARGCHGRDLVQRRPDDLDVGIAEPERVALDEPVASHAEAFRGQAQLPDACALAGHASLADARDAVAGREPGQSPGVVLVGMREDDEVDAPVPEWQALVEPADEQVRIRPAVDEHPRATGFEEDGIALADVEDADLEPARGSGDEDRAEDDDEASAGEEHGTPTPGPAGGR